MENQHRHIKGYRELSQGEIDLMNEIKAKGVELQALANKVATHINRQRCATTNEDGVLPPEALQAEQNRLNDANPERWAAIGRTHFQEGLMALTRAVAQPTFF